MAYLDLYITGSGSNLNSGTTTANAASVTSTGGTTSTSGTSTTFTAASGTPFASVTTSDWIAISNNATGGGADTATRFVAKVVSIGGSGASVTVNNQTATGSSLNVLGTAAALSSTSGGTDCRVGGAWASLSIAQGTGALTAIPISNAGTTSLRVNLKGGTYALTTSSLSIVASTTNWPTIWRGYNATPGDLDNVDNASTRPQITFSTGSCSVASYNRIENIDFTQTSTAGACVSTSGSGVMIHRSRITGSSSTSRTLDAIANGSISACYVYSSNSSGPAIRSGNSHLCGVVARGGQYAIQSINGGISIDHCVAESAGSHGIYSQANPISITNCLSYGNGGDGIRVDTAVQYGQIVNCILANNTGYGINFSLAGTHINIINPSFYSNTAGQVNGIPENGTTAETSCHVHSPISETSSPFSSSSTRDYTIKSSALSYQAGFPGNMESP